MKKTIIIFMAFIIILLQVSCVQNSEQEVDIVMTFDSSYFYNLSPEKAKEELNKLGFTKVELKAKDPSVATVEPIFSIITKNNKNDGAIAAELDHWHAGDVYKSTEKFVITYNSNPAITIENCEDLYKLTTSDEIDYREFAKKYDGKFIILKAHITYYDEYWGGTSQVISVAEGPYIYGEKNWHVFHINETLNSSFNDEYYVGQNVLVKGKINDYRTDYYKCVVIDCTYLKPDLLISPY